MQEWYQGSRTDLGLEENNAIPALVYNHCFLPILDQFCYLGTILTRDCSDETDVVSRNISQQRIRFYESFLIREIIYRLKDLCMLDLCYLYCYMVLNPGV